MSTVLPPIEERCREFIDRVKRQGKSLQLQAAFGGESFDELNRLLDDRPNQLFEDVLNIVREWQRKGRSGHCLPVLSGDLLERLENAAKESERQEPE